MPTSWPGHIAIIMDGNGRWAQEHGRLRIQGHREGARNVKRLTTFCSHHGLKVLTLYSFSVENWSRPETEVKLLMKLLRIWAVRERPTFMKDNVRLRVIGAIEDLPDFARKALLETVELTSKNTGLILQLALSYGGRDEIVRATRRIVKDARRGLLEADQVDESLFESYLDTSGLPDPDLVIRTSGEKRISNFLLWQSAYSEYYFTEKYWPDFREEDLLQAIEEFNKRDRRYGKVRIS